MRGRGVLPCRRAHAMPEIGILDERADGDCTVGGQLGRGFCLEPDRAGVSDICTGATTPADDDRKAERHRLEADVPAWLAVTWEDEYVRALVERVNLRTRQLAMDGKATVNAELRRQLLARFTSFPSPTTSSVTSRSRTRSRARMMSRRPLVRMIRPT